MKKALRRVQSSLERMPSAPPEPSAPPQAPPTTPHLLDLEEAAPPEQPVEASISVEFTDPMFDEEDDAPTRERPPQ